MLESPFCFAWDSGEQVLSINLRGISYRRARVSMFLLSTDCASDFQEYIFSLPGVAWTRAKGPHITLHYYLWCSSLGL